MLKAVHIFAFFTLFKILLCYNVIDRTIRLTGNFQPLTSSCVNEHSQVQFYIQFKEKQGTPKLLIYTKNKWNEARNKNCSEREKLASQSFNLEVDEKNLFSDCKYTPFTNNCYGDPPIGSEGNRTVYCFVEVYYPNEIGTGWLYSTLSHCDGNNTIKAVFTINEFHQPVAQPNCRVKNVKS